MESIHYGLICICDAQGNILYYVGDPDTPIYFRSSAKPIQVIPLIMSGAAKAYDFSLKDIALASSSHCGEEIHQQGVIDLLNRLELVEDNLHCGIMTPYSETVQKELMSQGKVPSVFHCSCSGKHMAMLALAKYKGLSLDNYEELSHPVQQELLQTIAAFAELEPESIPTGVDGCGVPIYILPAFNIALSYAKLVTYAKDATNPYYPGCKTVTTAMTSYPEMVAGEREFCTELMKVTKGKLIGKEGCEAVYCLGLKESGLGICLKIVDGHERAVYPAVIHTLAQLGILSPQELQALNDWYTPELKNNRGEIIGGIIPVFSLDKSLKTEITLGMTYRKMG